MIWSMSNYLYGKLISITGPEVLQFQLYRVMLYEVFFLILVAYGSLAKQTLAVRAHRYGHRYDIGPQVRLNPGLLR